MRPSSLTVQFTVHLAEALLLGAIVGMERQWRQRMAGTRTNALVAAGASAFVMAGSLLENDPSAPSRIASYVVSEGGNVRGLNTAATIWCSAAIGVLTGFGHPLLSLILAVSVLLANIALRPLSYRLHPALVGTAPVETVYEISLNCRMTEEAHMRALLLANNPIPHCSPFTAKTSQAAIALRSAPCCEPKDSTTRWPNT